MSFENQAKEWQASATLHLSGIVLGHTFWVHELLQQKILYYSCTQRKPPIIEMFITQARVSEVISAMWLIFGTEIPHHLGAWATKFQISNASFNEFITERSIKHKNQLLEPCINHRTLVDPCVSTIGNTLSNNHSADVLANKILIKILDIP